MPEYPPGPDDRFLGVALAWRLRKEPLKALAEMRAFGDIASFRTGPYRMYLVNHPDLIREVLITKAKSFRKARRQTTAFAKIDGNGLVVSEGDFWLRQRRLVQRVFHASRMRRYAEVMVEQTRRMLERWPTGEVEICDAMTGLTLAIIAKTMFDLDLDGQAARLGEAVRVLSQVLVHEFSSPVVLPDWVPLPGKRRKRWALATLDELIWGAIRNRRASGEDKGDLLSMLLLAVDEEGEGDRMTDQQARDEAMTLFNAGHDSTAAALAWVWHFVATQPGVQGRLVEEIGRVLGARPAAYGDVARLEYTQRVIKESMRIYPSTWGLFAREAIEDTEIGGWPIRKGSWMLAYQWVTHRDGRFFEDPQRFDPDRFAPGRVENIPHYAYFPFGAGPHVCIGNTFAIMEMTLIVASVLQRFAVEPVPRQGPVEPEALVALRPKGGLPLLVRQRGALATQDADVGELSA